MALISITINRGSRAHTPQSGRRRLAAVAGLAATVLGLTVAAVADEGPFIPTGYTPISHTLFSGRGVAAHRTTTAVVLGGATTVPYDADSVKIKVAVTGKGTGAVLVAPLGSTHTKVAATFNESQPATGYVTVAPGRSSSVVFTNISNVSVSVTAVLVAFAVPENPVGLHADIVTHADNLPLVTLPNGDAFSFDYSTDFGADVRLRVNNNTSDNAYSVTLDWYNVAPGWTDLPTDYKHVEVAPGQSMNESVAGTAFDTYDASGQIVIGTADFGVWTIAFALHGHNGSPYDLKVDATVVHGT
jgi:hypothetical protein